MFCIHMMKTVRLPNFKACTILLSLLFAYDIFFVFITPLFTKSGKSVMVDVATGGSSRTGEQLPMVLKVPRIATSKESQVCSLPYSLLGFGDILVPGLLTSYNYGFDLMVGSPKTYFVVSVIAYGLGLVATFIALALMATGQPALLYLVPFTLLSTTLVALKRGELRQIWIGDQDTDKNKTTTTTNTTSASSTIPPPAEDGRTTPVRRQVSREQPMSSPVDGSSVDQDASSQTSTDNEQSHLISR